MRHLKSAKRRRPAGHWTVITRDAGDGAGDVIIPLPTALLRRQGWKIGDRLKVKLLEPLEPGGFRLMLHKTLRDE